jgi:RNA polymerase sigma factor (sigma-70 family)
MGRPETVELAAESSRLLGAAQKGNKAALEQLFARELPALRRWVHGRVPKWMHSRSDPDDIVQLAAIRMLRQLRHLDGARYPSIQPYMRQTALNLVRDEARRAGRAPEGVPLEDDDAIYEPSPADAMFGKAMWRTYRRALKAIPARHRACIVGRIERGLSYTDLARELNRPSHGAARVAVGRALEALAVEMGVSSAKRGRESPPALARPTSERTA